MATRTATISINNTQTPFYTRVTWSGITESDTGGSATIKPTLKRGTVIFGGTFNGGTVSLQGSIDGTNYATLVDFLGNSISASAATTFEFETLVPFVQVSNNGSGSSEDVDVSIQFVDATTLT